MDFIVLTGGYDDHFFKNPALWDGKKIREVETSCGENLVDFHHQSLAISGDNEVKIVYLSNWYGQKGGRAGRYYPYLLSLFVWHGILFEDFSCKIPG